MLRIISVTCLMLLLLSITAFSQEVVPSKAATFVDLSKINLDAIKELLNPEKMKEVIFYAPPGYELSVKLALKGTVMNSDITKDNIVKVKFSQPVYCYFSPIVEEPYFSIDGKVWKPGKELFSGSISFSIGANEKEKQPSADFTFEVNLRGEKQEVKSDGK